MSGLPAGMYPWNTGTCPPAVHRRWGDGEPAPGA